MFSRVFTILLLAGVIALAIMFDWFGAQDLFKTGVSQAEKIVEKLSDSGDKLKNTFE